MYKLSKYLKFFVAILVVIFLSLLVMRILNLEEFNLIKNNFMAPAGKIMNSDKKTFSFMAISDTGARIDVMENILDNIKETNPEFIIHVGDFVDSAQYGHFEYMAKRISKKLNGKPFYAVPGNHDTIENGVVDYSMYETLFSQPYYWFSYGDTLFIGLDSSLSSLDSQQLEWLKVVMEKVRPMYSKCVIYCHVPPVTLRDTKNRVIEEKSNKKFAEIIKNKDISLIISGHLHDFRKGSFEGVPMIILPSSGQKIRSEVKQFGYAMIDVASTGVRVAEKYIDKDINIEEVHDVEYFIDVFVLEDEFYLIISIVLSLIVLVIGLNRYLQRKCYRKS